MPFLNVEIKAKCSQHELVRNYLVTNKAEFKGTDIQEDTYFNVSNGRLKLREGIIENNLIYYERNDQSGPKNSYFQLVKLDDVTGLKEVLIRSSGIKVVVKKTREIFFIGNVKFHLDTVKNLGSFVEIEAGNLVANYTRDQLLEQCTFYMQALSIKEEDLIVNSYSDLLLTHNNEK